MGWGIFTHVRLPLSVKLSCVRLKLFNFRWLNVISRFCSLHFLLLFFVVCSTAEPAHAQLMMFLNVLIVFLGLKSQTKNQNNREITCFLRKRAWWELHKTLKLKTKETKIWENSKQLKEFCKLYIPGMFLWFSLRRKNLSLTPLFNRNYMTLFGHVEDLHFIVNWWNWQ